MSHQIQERRKKATELWNLLKTIEADVETLKEAQLRSFQESSFIKTKIRKNLLSLSALQECANYPYQFSFGRYCEDLKRIMVKSLVSRLGAGLNLVEDSSHAP